MPPFGVSAQAHTRSASELATARCAPIPSTATLIAMAAAALAQEAKDRADFVVAQRAAGMLSDDLVQGQVHALLRSIRSSGHVAVSDATVVTNALVAGPWSPAQMGRPGVSRGRPLGQGPEGRHLDRRSGAAEVLSG